MSAVLQKLKNNRVTGFILKHKIISAVLTVILIALLVIFWPKPPPPLETHTVARGDIAQSVSASGAVSSDALVNLNFITAGKLVSLSAKKGDRVTKGQVIATLDQRTTQKNLENALIDYSKQRNNFEQKKDDEGVENILNAPNDEIRRILENNQYDLDKAVISVELQDLAKQASVLSTPIAGVLIRSDVTIPGVNIAPTTVFTVADVDNLVFTIDVDEADIGKIYLDQSANITLDAYPDEPIHIVVTRIDYASHTTSTGGNAYAVEAKMPVDASARYRIGMSGDAEIILAEKHDALSVPLSSIIDDTYVYVQGEKEFEKREVTLGIQNDTEIEVKEGLKEGEKVAISPSEVEKRQNIKRPTSTF